MAQAQFTREVLPNGDIEFYSVRLGAPVAREEAEVGNPNNRQFRVYSNGVQFLTEREFSELDVFAGWDIDGSNAAALESGDFSDGS